VDRCPLANIYPIAGSTSLVCSGKAAGFRCDMLGADVPHIFHACASRPDTSSVEHRLGAQQALRWVSAAVIRVETAVLSCMGLNGFAITTLSGTPFDDHSGALSPVETTGMSGMSSRARRLALHPA
jgi:hypothetical protein